MAYPSTPAKRPLIIAILAALIILGGFLLALLTAIAIFGVAFLGLEIPQAPTGVLLQILAVAFVLSLVLLAAGLGLWRMRRWAWYLAILATLGGLGAQLYGWYNAGSPPMTRNTMIAIGLSALMFIYLLVVNKHFRSRPA